MKQALIKDARYFQIVFQLAFLIYGFFFLQWNLGWWLYITYFIVSFTTQLFCEIIFKRYSSACFSAEWWKKFKSTLPSVTISALGLSLLLKTNHAGTAALAAFVSILLKYIIRAKGKHVFNPSASGIVITIFLTGDAWISTGQWGSNAVLFFSIFSFGCIVVTRVQKLNLSLAFLGTFVSLLFIRQVIFLGWPLDFFIQSISTGSLLLFSFFMISDPKTTPNHRVAGNIWAACIAMVVFYLATYQFINTAPVWVLVFGQPFVPLLDKVFKAEPFEWRHSSRLLSKHLFFKTRLI